MRVSKLTLILALSFLLSVTRACVADGAIRATNLKNFPYKPSNSMAGSLDVSVVPLGLPVAAWFLVDVDADGLRELAVASAESPRRVGVFDPKSGSWRDGPHILSVTGEEWSVRDREGDGYLDYLYRLGTDIRHFTTSSGADTVLWSVPSAPLSTFFWGRLSSGPEVVALLYTTATHTGTGPTTPIRWKWQLLNVWTGALLGVEFPGEPFGLQRLQRYPNLSDESVVIHASFSTITESWQLHEQSMVIVDSTWSVLASPWLPDVFMQGGNPPMATWGLSVCEVARYKPTDSHILNWQVNGKNGYWGWLWPNPFAGGRWVNGGALWSRSCYYPEACFSYNWYTTRAAAYDLDGDGSDEIIAPNYLGESWQIWDPYTGTLDSIIPNCPVAQLEVAALFEPEEFVLFHCSDSNLYIYQPDVQTGVFDNPETSEMPVDAEIVSAHPNPFNSAVTLSWSGEASSLTIYNVLGQVVADIPIDSKTSVTWDGCDSQTHQCPSGIYIAQVASRNFTTSTKIVLLR